MMTFSQAMRLSTALTELGFDAARTGLSAAEVMWRRTDRLARGALSLSEATRMITEKQSAFSQAGTQAAMAALHRPLRYDPARTACSSEREP